MLEVLIPACTSVVVALVPVSGDADLYVGWNSLVDPSSSEYYEASQGYGSGPEYSVLCCDTSQAQPFASGTPLYLNVNSYTASSWTLHVFDMNAPIPIEPLYPFGALPLS